MTDPSGGKWLEEALGDLHQIQEQASGDGYVPPSDGVLERSKRILRFMYPKIPFRYEIYYLQEGSVSVELAPRDPNLTLSMYAEEGGRAICFLTAGSDRTRRAYFPSVDVMLEGPGFLHHAIEEVTQHPHFRRRQWKTREIKTRHYFYLTSFKSELVSIKSHAPYNINERRSRMHESFDHRFVKSANLPTSYRDQITARWQRSHHAVREGSSVGLLLEQAKFDLLAAKLGSHPTRTQTPPTTTRFIQT